MRTGCDGSRETLYTRNLIRQEDIYCHWCGIVESRQHILEQCELYNQPRRKLKNSIENIR